MGAMDADSGRNLPYRVATLLYCFDPADRVLLLERLQEPNRGLWSPPGGKLQMDYGESPFACAIREAKEELAIELMPSQLHLTGIVSERAYQDESHWLMFLFEINPRLPVAPPAHREGQFQFHEKGLLETLAIPKTDRDQIWPLFWQHRGGFFSAHCQCRSNGDQEWFLESSLPADHTSAREK